MFHLSWNYIFVSKSEHIRKTYNQVECKHKQNENSNGDDSECLFCLH